MSRRELERKLAGWGAGEEEQAAVCDRLEELGILNDAQYAEMIVRHYSAKGCGERKLRDELYRRGVPRDCWEEALAEAQDPEDEIDQFIRRKMRGGRTPRGPREPSSAPPTPWPAGATGGRRSRRGWSATARHRMTNKSAGAILWLTFAAYRVNFPSMDRLENPCFPPVQNHDVMELGRNLIEAI